MVTVTQELLEQGLSVNGAWSRKQLVAIGVPVRKRFKLIKGWKDRLIGSVITEQQKTRFLALKDAHIKKDITEPLFEDAYTAMNNQAMQHMQEMSKNLPGFKDIIGLYADDESAVSTARIRKNLIGCYDCDAWLYGDRDEALPCDQCLMDDREIDEKLKTRLSLGQIQDHCEKIDNLCLTAHPDGELMFKSSQIIKELLERIDCLIVETAFT